MENKLKQIIEEFKDYIDELTLEEKVEAINTLKSSLTEISPFQEPVDYVRWVKSSEVIANQYNP